MAFSVPGMGYFLTCFTCKERIIRGGNVKTPEKCAALSARDRFINLKIFTQALWRGTTANPHCVEEGKKAQRG
jgi:hypothetical protein